MVLLILALKATEGRPQQQQGPQKVGPQKQHQLRRNIDNCWALVDETYWPRIINFDQATSTIRIFIQQTGPRVLRCLQGMIYFLIVVGGCHLQDLSISQVIDHVTCYKLSALIG